MFDQWENEAKDDVLNYLGSDVNVMKSKQMSARIIRETRAMINRHIDDAIQAGKDVLIQQLKRER